MRKIVFAALLASLAVGLVPAATATTAKTVAVSITNSAFVPKSVTITTGDTVKWTNKGTQNQQVVCAKCPFTSPVLKPGDTYSHTFKVAGRFPITDPLRAKIKGTVIVNLPSGVTLSAKPKVIKYLQSTTLSGTLGSGKANQNIDILARACGQTNYAHDATVKTGSGGAYILKEAPTTNTVYEAKAGSSTSKLAPVRVRPRIRLAKIGAHRFSVKVKAARSLVGRRVLFQKQTPTLTWSTVKRVKLKKLTIVGTTDISKATFKSRIRHGKKVRMLMKSKQAAPCYIGNHSNTITS